MQFLKTLLIVLAVALAVAFAFNNWVAVPIRLWGGLIAEINLPLLLAGCFLAGLLPTWLWHRALRWRLGQRLAASERTVADLRAVSTPAAPPVDTDTPPANTAPPLIDEPRI